MTPQAMVTVDGNEAAAYVAHELNGVIASYPITPSSAIGEWADFRLLPPIPVTQIT